MSKREIVYTFLIALAMVTFASSIGVRLDLDAHPVSIEAKRIEKADLCSQRVFVIWNCPEAEW